MENLLVYHVDIGRWITCDFSVLNETVSELKLQIERKSDIPVSKQVLLVSGGGHLDPSKAVSCYCAGTDTSPFFLFSKRLIDHPEPPSAYFDPRPDIDFTREHQQTQGMLPTIEALNVRVALAQQYSEHAQYNLNCIETLINDQHMMHQGWSAAVANMLDTVEKFKFKADLFEIDFKRYLDGREHSISLLQNFENILSDISKIPMLPALLESNTSEQPKLNCSTVDKNKKVHKSLFEWVTARQGLSNLEHLVEHCENSLKQFDEEMLTAVLHEVQTMNECSKRSDCSEIKGLEHRLYKLAQMMDESKRLATEQFNLAEAIKMNHAKASDEGDLSVISVLLASHDKQLEMMSKNNSRLCDIRNRSILAKQELCNNLHPRLKWLIVIENKVSDIEAIMLLYSDSVKLTREYLDVVEQLKNTPKLYFSAVGEIVRRRIFSQALLIWSSDLACHMMARHSDEIAKRKNFQSQFDGHFLTPLFPGLEDMPPAFATQAPPIFDYNLPKLCLEDLDTLVKQLPHIANVTSIPNFNAITQFFLSKSIQEDGTLAIECSNDHKSVAMETSNGMLADMDSIEAKLNEVIRVNVGIGTCKMDMEQEPDAFKRTHLQMENDSFGPDSFLFPPKYIGTEQKHTIKLLTNSLYNLQSVTHVSMNTLRSDLDLLKQYLLQQNVEMNIFVNDLLSKYNMQTSHMNDLVQYVKETNFELERTRMRVNELESLVEIHLKNEVNERQLRLRYEDEREEWMERNLEHARKEITNKLTIEHKIELEMMQARFKSVTKGANMERSSSELSLEKNKRYDVIELANHEAMMAQLKEDLLLEKEQALQNERKHYEQILTRERQLKIEEIKDDQVICLWGDIKKQTDDKNRSSKYIKEKNTNEFRSSIHSQKTRSNSVSVTDWGFMESGTSSVSLELNKSSSSESESGKLCVSSCNVGDYVLVVWDYTYKNYVVYQENRRHLVFLHPDSIDTLSLKPISDDNPNAKHFSAEISQKEYCQAVKEDNRYRVKKGKKFYRVKVQLLKESNRKRDTSISDSSLDQLTFVQ